MTQRISSATRGNLLSDSLLPVQFADGHELAEMDATIPDPILATPIRLCRGERTLIWGAPNTRKTWLTVHALCKAAANAARVLLLSGEGALPLVAQRARWVAAGVGLDLSLQREGFVVGQGAFALADPHYASVLSQAIGFLGATVVAFDPFVAFSAGIDENNAPDMYTCLRVLDEIVAHHDCAIVLVHHARKDGRSPRGSTALMGWLDAAYHVSEVPRLNRSRVDCTKQRWVERSEPFSFELSVADNVATLSLASSGTGASPQQHTASAPVAERVLCFLRGRGAPTSKQAIRDALGTSGTTTDRAIRSLVKAGQVAEVRGGTRKEYDAIPGGKTDKRTPLKGASSVRKED